MLYNLFVCSGVPVDFDVHHISELDPDRSDSLETVVESIKRNRICLKGILASPEYNADGEAKTLNMKLR